MGTGLNRQVDLISLVGLSHYRDLFQAVLRSLRGLVVETPRRRFFHHAVPRLALLLLTLAACAFTAGVDPDPVFHRVFLTALAALWLLEASVMWSLWRPGRAGVSGRRPNCSQLVVEENISRVTAGRVASALIDVAVLLAMAVLIELNWGLPSDGDEIPIVWQRLLFSQFAIVSLLLVFPFLNLCEGVFWFLANSVSRHVHRCVAAIVASLLGTVMTFWGGVAVSDLLEARGASAASAFVFLLFIPVIYVASTYVCQGGVQSHVRGHSSQARQPDEPDSPPATP